MFRLNIHEAKTHLSKYIEKILASGEKIILCNRNVPVAEIRPLSPQKGNRSLGLAKNKFKISKKFFEPLPRDILNSFWSREK